MTSSVITESFLSICDGYPFPLQAAPFTFNILYNILYSFQCQVHPFNARSTFLIFWSTLFNARSTLSMPGPLFSFSVPPFSMPGPPFSMPGPPFHYQFSPFLLRVLSFQYQFYLFFIFSNLSNEIFHYK